MTENITPTNINLWNMTENVRQRLTIMGENDQMKNNSIFTKFFGHIHPFKLVVLMNLHGECLDQDLLGFGANHSLLFLVQYWHHHIDTRQIQ